MSISDNETTAMWAEHHAERAAKRARNRQASADMLKAAGIAFEAYNNDAHLVVAKRFDFWPGTGLWKDRQTGKTSRGVTRLIEHIGSAK